MTTTTPAPALALVAGDVASILCPHRHEHAPDHAAYCVHCRAIADHLPKLKQPTWILEQMGTQIREEAPKINEDYLTPKDRKKAAKARHKQYLAERHTVQRIGTRFQRHLAGERTRVRHAA